MGTYETRTDPGTEAGAESHGASDGLATLPTRCDRCHAPAPHFEAAYWGETLCRLCAEAAGAEYEADGWPGGAWEWPYSQHVLTVGRIWAFDDRLGAYWAEGDRLLVDHAPRRTARPLVDLALHRNRRQIWLHRSALEALELPESIPPPQRERVSSPWLEASGVAHLDAWMRFRVGRQTVNVAVPSWETRRQLGERPLWDQPETPETLFAELSAFEGALGHLWVHSGAITSDALLREHWHGRIHRAELPDESFALPKLEDTDQQTLTPAAGRVARWCYAFDLHGMFLGAASGLALPAGPPRAANDGDDPARIPGYWHIAGQHGRWITSPTAAGAAFILDAGWVYPEHHQYLQPWYKALRDARAALRGDSVAQGAVKAVYTQGIGRLGSSRRTDEADPLWQPYWRHAVVAEARERLRRRIAELGPGGTVVAVDTDALFVLSDREDARVLALELGLPLGPGLGQFHVLGRCKGRQATELLAGRGIPRRGTIIGELRKAVDGAG